MPWPLPDVSEVADAQVVAKARALNAAPAPHPFPPTESRLHLAAARGSVGPPVAFLVASLSVQIAMLLSAAGNLLFERLRHRAFTAPLCWAAVKLSLEPRLKQLRSE